MTFENATPNLKRTPNGIRYLVVLSALTLSSLCLAQPPAEPEHTKDSLATVKKNLAEKKAVLLDVREQAEWDAGRLQQAKLLPLSTLQDDEELKSAAKKLDKKQIIYTHCRAGGRALMAAEILRKQGFDVRPLKQGYEELLKAGFPAAPAKDK